jgi:glycosyltransferase involved in cell wall biosynthesis
MRLFMKDKRYKILVNTSTLMQGGGLQVAAAMIVHAVNDPIAKDWQYMVSANAARELKGFGVDITDPRFHVFDKSPARHEDERKRALKIEAAMQPDLVFTLFGPAYVRFKSRHLCGVADPWVTHSNSIAFRKLGLVAGLKTFALMLWKAYWWKKVDYWWTEAPIARDGLVSRLGCPSERIFIIPNTTGPQFDGRDYRPEFPHEKRVEILCLSAYYPHKDLEILPDVARQIRKLDPELKFRFTVTLPEGSPEVQKFMQRVDELGVKDCVRNIGRVPVTETPALYQQSHLSFLPSLLEVFSAVYPESFCTGVPLVTTDLRFARDICGDAAAYFTPTDPQSAAEQIVALASDAGHWQQISDSGRKAYQQLPNATEKWALQKSMLLDVAGRTG